MHITFFVHLLSLFFASLMQKQPPKFTQKYKSFSPRQQTHFNETYTHSICLLLYRGVVSFLSSSFFYEGEGGGGKGPPFVSTHSQSDTTEYIYITLLLLFFSGIIWRLYSIAKRVVCLYRSHRSRTRARR